ncbi:hypothetical protein EV589_0460 [Mycobacterium sp. BK558]|uniref:Uncharacterized protein n=1 Tax=Mycolicibacterium chlorophenolicum TaxID=37916 RepID=A0A0J6VJE0_9MYCO|nr:hypothetical protein [Mycolicibacterium chlorophenolicum]KMO70384.1 hypothetical protein MCHLDSM_05272 [Mycolicibacterium chlorophenolicum]RZT24739.1 hypothetical protein EV589_0460 [Mycobacterium sp. BK558]
MCGGCAGAPPDWAAEWVSGPRRRMAVARRMTALMKRDRVAALPSGWTVTSATGATVVCRTYDDLVAAVSRRSGIDPGTVSEAGLGGILAANGAPA